MRVSVPTSTVDNTYEAFPEGAYNGQITGAEVRDPNKDGSWLLIKLSVDNVTPKEGTNDPGRDRFSSDIVIKTDGVDIREVEDPTDRDLPYVIRRASGLLAGLAEAVGVADRSNGAVEVDLSAVAEALIDGSFEGDAVGFEVSHWTPKDATSPRDQFNRFGPAS